MSTVNVGFCDLPVNNSNIASRWCRGGVPEALAKKAEHAFNLMDIDGKPDVVSPGEDIGAEVKLENLARKAGAAKPWGESKDDPTDGYFGLAILGALVGAGFGGPAGLAVGAIVGAVLSIPVVGMAVKCRNEDKLAGFSDEMIKKYSKH